jgi:DMSO/TMAO reductase YedYZ molybdopterin-dependent catalytic subunit
MRSAFRALFATALTVLLASSLQAQATVGTTLQLVGETGARTEISLDSLRRLPQEELKGRIHDGPELVFRGPSLAAVLALAGAPQGRAMRGPALRLVALAEARDGYAVVYSLAELSPDFGGRKGIVAVEQDGKPLGEEDGPLRIVLEGDQRPARWIRQLERISIVKVGN